MSTSSTPSELVAKASTLTGAFMTVANLQAAVGIVIGLGGFAATWWLARNRNRREQQQRDEDHAEHLLRMEQIRRNPDRRARVRQE